VPGRITHQSTPPRLSSSNQPASQNRKRVVKVKGVVRVQALLRGMGCEADCRLLTWKESSTTGRTYTRCRILDDPPDLPDGAYRVFFAGYSIPTRKFEGSWMLTFLPPGIDLEKAA